ncbi:hypothetical protein N825_30570 [Skermanella stibiiresistens SB22]|uniref:Uncharacterized protein n=1 Tax=Skermanella stibiiresistens SB22 TaxID=1385369 RepID=W9H5B3_9PROT|nr:hypothetical protein N825_30570 [Skermanella stibiiresistens SB22]
MLPLYASQRGWFFDKCISNEAGPPGGGVRVILFGARKHGIVTFNDLFDVFQPVTMTPVALPGGRGFAGSVSIL